MAAFAKAFPHDDPKKKGNLVWRTDRHTGKQYQAVKVYNDDEGVEDFSEGSEGAVEKDTVVDDGRMILGDAQIEEAFAGAVDATLSGFKEAGMTRSELGQAPPPEKHSATTPTKEKKDEQCDEEGSSSSDSGELQTPMAKRVRRAVAETTAERSKKAKDKEHKDSGDDRAGAAVKGLAKNSEVATRSVQRWKDTRHDICLAQCLVRHAAPLNSLVGVFPLLSSKNQFRQRFALLAVPIGGGLASTHLL